MTRINVVPVEELCDKHLIAEFHELPRIFTEVKKLLAKGGDPARIEAPEEYVLGTGHMKFFYNRLGWLRDRHAELTLELIRRGKNVNIELLRGMTDGIPTRLMKGWKPTQKALELNRDRIEERLIEMNSKTKRPVTKVTETE